MRRARLGGVLADDMGLGKTLQALALLQAELDAGRLDRPSLVIVPTSLLGNWQAEAMRFTPQLKVLVLHGPRRTHQFKQIAQAHLVITSYPLACARHHHPGFVRLALPGARRSAAHQEQPQPGRAVAQGLAHAAPPVPQRHAA